MTLIDKQAFFAQQVALLIQHAQSLGYLVTLGEAYRPAVTASYYAAMGEGVNNSLHTKRLAIDLNLFMGTTFLTSIEDYRDLGNWWTAQSTPDYQLVWGGKFQIPDCDHFSLADGGVE